MSEERHTYFRLHDSNTLLYNSCFVNDADIDYAKHHRFNVLFTETGCSDTFKIISKFIKAGYRLEIYEKPNYVTECCPLPPTLWAHFILEDD